MNTSINRRAFIQKSSCGIAGIGIASGLVLPHGSAIGAQPRSLVVSVRDERAISSRNVCDEKEAVLMVDNALATLTGKKNPKEIWAALGVKPNDVVAVKLNCNSSAYPLFSHPELVNALCASLSSIVPQNNIILYERYGLELEKAGFKVNRSDSGVRCIGGDDGAGYHPEEGLTRIITDTSTKLINFCSLKVHDEDRFLTTLFLKNHIGSLVPDTMRTCHDNIGILAQIQSRPSIRKKTVLNFCDGLRATFKPASPWFWGGIFVSRDPVAAEYAALQVINEKLKAEGAEPFPVPSYVQAAETEFKLGTCNPDRIELKTMVL
jgi:hypothetical protein